MPGLRVQRPAARACRRERRRRLAEEQALRLLGPQGLLRRGPGGASSRAGRAPGPRGHCSGRTGRVLSAGFDTCGEERSGRSACSDLCAYPGWEPLNMSCIFWF